MTAIRNLKITLSLACMLIAMPSMTFAADDVKWSEDIEGSLRAAADAGRPVLMEFTASWCVYCKRMEKTTFHDPAVMSRISKGYVPVRVDADKHKDLVQELGIKGLPAILIVSPDLQIIERISGFQTAEALVAKLDQASAAQRPTVDTRTVQAPRVNQPEREAQMRRGDLEFEAITQEEAPQARRPNVRPVSQPVAPEPDFSGFEASLERDNNRDDANQAEADLNDNPFAEESSDPTPETRVARPSGRRKTATPAFAGQCLVSAVEDRELIPGTSRSTLEYRGKLLYFRSDAHKEQFEAEPAKYWPMLDGSCAMSQLNDDESVEGQLQYAAVFRKQIWLFASERLMKDFLLDPAEVAEEIADRSAE